MNAEHLLRAVELELSIRMALAALIDSTMSDDERIDTARKYLQLFITDAEQADERSH